VIQPTHFGQTALLEMSEPLFSALEIICEVDAVWPVAHPIHEAQRSAIDKILA
jgi:hypothetical protein